MHEALRDPEVIQDSAGLQAFLQNEETICALSKSLDPAEGPSAKTKTDFETRTAAIHVTPSSNGNYDIKQIREDVLWLSDRVKIDHITALRIATIEWQERPKNRLLRGYSEEEEIALQQAVGVASFHIAGSTPENRSRTALETFNSAKQRHLRLLRVWLTEGTHSIGVLSAIETLSSLDYPAAPPGRSYGSRNGKRSTVSPWMAQASRKMSEARAERVDSMNNSSRTDFVSQSIETLRRYLEAFDNGHGWSGTEDLDPLIEEEYQYSQLLSVFHVLQLLFIQINSTALPPPLRAVTDWFKLLERMRFLNDFNPVRPIKPACRH